MSYIAGSAGFISPSWQGYATEAKARDTTAPTVTIDGGATVGNPLDSLDTSVLFSGNLPWSDPTDSFVDVYAYSSPILLGTFPVVNSMVILGGVNLTTLQTGAHHLVFVGQTSGTVQVLNITVQPAATTAGAATATRNLAATGPDTSAPVNAALALGLLGAALLLNQRRITSRR